MAKQVSASNAKNNFGGLLEDVAALGLVEVVKHGRVVAIVLSPRALEEALGGKPGAPSISSWGDRHMIPPVLARAAKMIRRGAGFDDD